MLWILSSIWRNWLSFAESTIVLSVFLQTPVQSQKHTHTHLSDRWAEGRCCPERCWRLSGTCEVWIPTSIYAMAEKLDEFPMWQQSFRCSLTDYIVYLFSQLEKIKLPISRAPSVTTSGGLEAALPGAAAVFSCMPQVIGQGLQKKKKMHGTPIDSSSSDTARNAKHLHQI